MKKSMVNAILLFGLAAAGGYLIYLIYQKTRGPSVAAAGGANTALQPKGSSPSNPGPLPPPSNFDKSAVYYDVYGGTSSWDGSQWTAFTVS